MAVQVEVTECIQNPSSQAAVQGDAPGPVQAVLVVTADTAEETRALVDVTLRARDLLEASRAVNDEQIALLVERLRPHDGHQRAVEAIEFESARARADFLRRHETLSSAEVAALAGHTARNRSLTASRWRRAGRIFAVPQGGEERYPAFQFQDGAPRPIVARVLEVLSPSLTPWEIAFWFVADNAWLEQGGSATRPVDRLDNDDRVLAAARGAVASVF